MTRYFLTVLSTKFYKDRSIFSLFYSWENLKTWSGFDLAQFRDLKSANFSSSWPQPHLLVYTQPLLVIWQWDKHSVGLFALYARLQPWENHKDRGEFQISVFAYQQGKDKHNTEFLLLRQDTSGLPDSTRLLWNRTGAASLLHAHHPTKAMQGPLSKYWNILISCDSLLVCFTHDSASPTDKSWNKTLCPSFSRETSLSKFT